MGNKLLLKILIWLGGRLQKNGKNYPVIYKDFTEYYIDCSQSEAINKIVKLYFVS